MRVFAPRIQSNDPIVEIFKKIAVRQPFRNLVVLDTFVGTGLNMTKNYAILPWVKHLVGWEKNPDKAAACKKFIPDAEIAHCDTYKEVHKLRPSFDVIIIDNNLLMADTFEHFDLFPAIFKGLKDGGFIVISVCQSPGSYYVKREHTVRGSLGSRTEDWVKDWDKARADFYRFPRITMEDYATLTGRIMPMSDFPANDMVPVYSDLALKCGFFTAYKTVQKRSAETSWVLIEVSKFTPRQELEEKTKDKLLKKNAGKL